MRRDVLILRAEGIETFEARQGGEGRACPEPIVRFHGNAWEGHKAIAMTYAMPVLDVRLASSVTNGHLAGPWWEMTFRTTDPLIQIEKGGGWVSPT